MGLEGRAADQTHLDVDPDRERDAFLQLLGLLVEVLAELPNGDASLDTRKGQKGAFVKLGCTVVMQMNEGIVF